MADIRTSDYAAEYKFKETSGPRFQETKLRIAGSEPVRRNVTVGESDDRIIQRDYRAEARIVPSEYYHSQDISESSSYKSFGVQNGNIDTRNTDIGGKNADVGEKIGDSDSDFRDSPPFAGVSNCKSDYLNWKNEIAVRNRRRRKDSGRNRNGRYTATGRVGRERGGKRVRDVRSKKGESGNAVSNLKGKLKAPVKNAFSDLKRSAENTAGSGQNSGMNSYAYAQDTFAEQSKRSDQLAEALKMIVKVIKAVATATFLPILAIMLFVALVIASIVSIFSDADSQKGQPIANPTTNKQIIYNGLLEVFDGNETATIGVMCALMAESGCNPMALEAASKWGITGAEYTKKVNNRKVTKEDFINSTYNGIQGNRGYGIAQWSTKDRKKGLYEFAVTWAKENSKSFDIGNIDMQVAHLQNTINSSYSSLKESLIKATDMEEACYLWISTYEKPSEKYSTWREKAQRDIKNFKAELCEECEVGRRALSNGIFLWPCPSSHNVTSYFGNRTPPTDGATSDHKAIDIGAAKGASVIAAADGKVTSVSYSNARGYFIVVNHGNGYVTLYQHLSRQDVKQGNTVKTGQQIGAVGDTGISSGPHLHFEVHENGTPVDPMKFFN